MPPSTNNEAVSLVTSKTEISCHIAWTKMQIHSLLILSYFVLIIYEMQPFTCLWFFSDYILLLKSCLKNAYRLWLPEIFGNVRQRPVGINEKSTWADMGITRHVCCGQASSNNSEVSVPSFSGRPTFTHLSQTPSANSQLSNNILLYTSDIWERQKEG